MSVASDQIENGLVHPHSLDHWGDIGRELADVLRRRNGCYACESSLLIRPLQRTRAPLGLIEWNAAKLWKDSYNLDLGDVLFFAEDVFGGRSAVANEICYFDPETSTFEVVAGSINGWAGWLMAEFEVRTGYPLAHEWQLHNGPLTAGQFFSQGSHSLSAEGSKLKNLYHEEEVAGMLSRAVIAHRIGDVPDGAEVIFEVRNSRWSSEKSSPAFHSGDTIPNC